MVDVKVKARVLGAVAAAMSLMIGVGACSPASQESPRVEESLSLEESPSTSAINGSSDGLESDAEADLPPLSPEEQQTKADFERYGLGLSLWLIMEGVSADDYENPVVGTWANDGGDEMVAFTDSEFTWHWYDDDLDDNYDKGTYYVLPGARPEVDYYVLDRGEGWENYSVFLHYTLTRAEGVDTPTNYHGVFIVECQGSPDSLYVRNLRNDKEFYVTRVVP
jgi:hypothetical protein